MRTEVASMSTDRKPRLAVRTKTSRRLTDEAFKVVNSFALLEPSSHDANLVLLVHSIDKLQSSGV